MFDEFPSNDYSIFLKILQTADFCLPDGTDNQINHREMEHFVKKS